MRWTAASRARRAWRALSSPRAMRRATRSRPLAMPRGARGREWCAVPLWACASLCEARWPRGKAAAHFVSQVHHTGRVVLFCDGDLGQRRAVSRRGRGWRGRGVSVPHGVPQARDGGKLLDAGHLRLDLGRVCGERGPSEAAATHWWRRRTLATQLHRLAGVRVCDGLPRATNAHQSDRMRMRRADRPCRTSVAPCALSRCERRRRTRSPCPTTCLMDFGRGDTVAATPHTARARQVAVRRPVRPIKPEFG